MGPAILGELYSVAFRREHCQRLGGSESGLAIRLFFLLFLLASLLLAQTNPTLPVNTWEPITPTYVGAPNGGQIWPSGWGNKGSFDPVSQRVIISDRWYDAIHGNSIFANGIHAYDPVQNTFTILKLNNWYAQYNSQGGYTTTPLPANTTDPTPPDHHPLTELEIVPALNALFTVNGVNSISLPDPTILNKTWKFDLTGHFWTLVSSAATDPNYPPNYSGNPSGLTYDPITQKLAYFVISSCGCSGTTTYLFDPFMNVWTILPQDPSAVGVYVSGAGVTYDSKRNLIIAFGGNANITISATPQLLAYSVAQNKWTELPSAPVSAMAASLAYDSNHDLYVALVGTQTYIYNPTTNLWMLLPTTLARPPSAPQSWQGITYDPVHDLFVFEGGNWQTPYMALLRLDPSSFVQDTTPPVVSITAPLNNATVSGTTTIAASATDNVGVAGVQFQVDGINLGPMIGAVPYSMSWNTTQATNATHTLTAIASDWAGNTATASVSVSVNNPLVPPNISGVTASSITPTSAVIIWTTDQASNSQVAYGTSSAYGSSSALAPGLFTAHSVTLSQLSGSTTYYYEVLSQNAQGALSSAGGFTFTTPTAPTTLLQIEGNASEVSGMVNGSIVTPSITPAGFTGKIALNGAGSVNFTPAVAGNGVYFLNCCSNTGNAYYKFTGATVGSIFNISQGQISFQLTSRYSYAQRQASAAGQRFAFDVRDGAGNHLFYFRTQISSGLQFSYTVAGTTHFYWAPAGSEDTLFGNGVTMTVLITWNGTTSNLYLNGAFVQSGTYTPATPSWTAASNFDLGAYEYLSAGGYNELDDIISGFTVAGPPIIQDTTPPVVSITAPLNNATVSGTTTIAASATDNVGVTGVQFQVDGKSLGGMIGAVPYSMSWNTTLVTNGTHTLTAIASDAAGNTATASVSVSVNNPLVPPTISGVTASSITPTSAVIIWTTDQGSNSQVAYGTSSAYGSSSALAPALVTAHSVTLSQLSGSTTYYYEVLSQNAQGALSTAGGFTFTTPAAPTTLLQIQGNASEVSGMVNGSIVTPSITPAGFTGKIALNGAGSVNFTPAVAGNGVYFLNCCSNTGNAYYKFTGATVGSIFNISQGQISFQLTSRYSYAQRQASAAGQRFAFDVRDGAGNHLFYFRTQISSGLQFTYTVGGSPQFYWAPAGTEDTLFGNGVTMTVLITWNGTTSNLYLNGAFVQSGTYTPATPSWTAASNFDLGAYEYLSAGGYNELDDIISGFTVAGPPIVQDTTPPVVSITAPLNNATVSGTTTIAASATDNVGVTGVQFQVDGINLGGMIGAPPYSASWNTTLVTNATHTLTAIASDAAGNTATASVSVSVNNPLVPPTISGVTASSITPTSAVITWTTDQASNSQVAYGTSSAYGSSSALAPALVTAHSVTLSQLSGSTTYYYEVLSQNAQGALSTAGGFTFTTPAAPTTLLQIQGNASEVSGMVNGSIVTPSITPAGFTGKIALNGAGSVNFTPAVAGNGVYFLNCCSNTGNAYYKFTSATVGSIFNISQGQISFQLTSRYSYAQRQASAAGQRFAFDVRDGAGNHLFYFRTQISSGLQFTYTVAGTTHFYWAPAGSEDTLFGNGVTMTVLITWNGTTSNLYLNGALVQSGTYTPATPSWTAASNFDLGAYEYLSFGGYNELDDIISGFTVAGPSQ